jgi:hypothetical protein
MLNPNCLAYTTRQAGLMMLWQFIVQFVYMYTCTYITVHILVCTRNYWNKVIVQFVYIYIIVYVFVYAITVFVLEQSYCTVCITCIYITVYVLVYAITVFLLEQSYCTVCMYMFLHNRRCSCVRYYCIPIGTKLLYSFITSMFLCMLQPFHCN